MNLEKNNDFCKICKKKGNIKFNCPQCKMVIYCSKECQKRDLSFHKKYCGINKIEESNDKNNKQIKSKSRNKTKEESLLKKNSYITNNNNINDLLKTNQRNNKPRIKTIDTGNTRNTGQGTLNSTTSLKETLLTFEDKNFDFNQSLFNIFFLKKNEK